MPRSIRSLTGALTVAALWAAARPSAAQTTYSWTGTGAGGATTATAWLTTANWTSTATGTWPGVTAAPSASHGTVGDVATFPLTSGPSGPIGIDMGAGGGALSLGAISLAGTIQTMTINNSSTTFFPATTLQLN